MIMMERTTGRGAVTYSDGEPEDPDPESFDLANMHWIGGNQRNVRSALNFQVKLADFLQGAHVQFVSLKMGKAVRYDEMPVADKYLQGAFSAHRTSVNGVLDDCLVIGERAQGQLNAVLVPGTWIDTHR